MQNKHLIIGIFLGILLITLTVTLASLNKPYKTVNRFIEDAIDNKDESNYLITDKEWENIKNNSTFSLVRREVDWEVFKSKIKIYKEETIKIGEKYSLWDKLKTLRQNDMHINVYIYNYKGVEIDRIPLLIVKVNGNWKIVGN